MVSGSRRIYADSALSYPAFLSAWARGKSFMEATSFANSVDPLRAQDATAKGFLYLAGYRSWWDVDSTRWRMGYTSLRITTQVLGNF